MPQHIDENGDLINEIFRVSPDYHLLSKEEKIDVLRLVKDWLDLQVIKIQFED
jgi:hypothetical protein